MRYNYYRNYFSWSIYNQLLTAPATRIGRFAISLSLSSLLRQEASVSCEDQPAFNACNMEYVLEQAAARRRAYNHMDGLGITAFVIIVFFIPQVDPIDSRLRKHLAFYV